MKRYALTLALTLAACAPPPFTSATPAGRFMAREQAAVDAGTCDGFTDQCATLPHGAGDCSDVAPGAIAVINAREAVCTCCDDGGCHYVEVPCTLGANFGCDVACPYKPIANLFGDGSAIFGATCTTANEGATAHALSTDAVCVCCTSNGDVAVPDSPAICAWSAP